MRQPILRALAAIAALLLLALAGCASASTMSPEAERVLLLASADGLQCTQLGLVEGAWSSGWSPGDNSIQAMKEARNQVAARGGNAMGIVQTSQDLFRSIVVARALICVKLPPARPAAPTPPTPPPDHRPRARLL